MTWLVHVIGIESRLGRQDGPEIGVSLGTEMTSSIEVDDEQLVELVLGVARTASSTGLRDGRRFPAGSFFLSGCVLAFNRRSQATCHGTFLVYRRRWMLNN